ncbi:hypothetical protein ACU61A_15965 [Pseudonocardia sichuanensis]
MPELRYPCDPCGKPVTTATGGIWIDTREVHRVEVAQRAWKAEHEVANEHGLVMYDMGQLLDAPDPARWRISHWTCLPEGVNDYGLELPTDHARWLHHVAHVMEKEWVLEATDLSDLVREAGEGTGRCRPAT